MDLLSVIELAFASKACLNGSFLEVNHFCCTSRHHGIDLESASKAFENIRKVENESLRNVVGVNDY